jgi:ABC-type hemin transport system ATPase subunit
VRFKSLHLSWFRGASDPVALDAACKSMVVYGPNGAGKSSFVDAMEYAIRDGKIAHLTHEYSGRNQEKAIVNTHTPTGKNTELEITFQDDSKLGVRIARNGTHSISGAGSGATQTWEYRRMILRQDEVADFIRSRKGEKYSALLPLFGLHDLEVAAENLRQLVRAIERKSALAHKEGAFGQTRAKRTQVFGTDGDEQIQENVMTLHSKYCPNSPTINILVCCNDLEAAIAERMSVLSVENQRHVTLSAIVNANLTGALQAVRNANAMLAASVEPLIKEKLEVLRSVSVFATAMVLEGEVACPACGRPVPVSEFRAHVKSEQERLREIIASFEERRTAITVLIDVVKSIKATFAKTELTAWRETLESGTLKRTTDWIGQYLPEALRRSLIEADLATIENNCFPIIGAAKEASRNAPPDVKDLSDDKALIEAAKAVFMAKDLEEQISRTQELIAFLNAVETGVRDEIRTRSEAVIKCISTDIGTMWKTLHPGEPIEDVRLYLQEDDKAIDIALKFFGKEQDSPRLTLSEGYRNSLGLCIFLALAKQEVGYDRPLFLDDVVISLDRNHRGMIVQLIEDEFANRQVIILTHDRGWYSELRQQLDDKRWQFRTLLPYDTPALGIRWSHKTTTFDDARASLNHRLDSAGNDARKIMDVELAIAAERLQMRLPYMQGDRNDKRTAHDFLERLSADGKRCFQKKVGSDYVCNTDALGLFDKADKLLVSWGNRASHTFDLVRPEATKLIDTCEQAVEAFHCVGCHKNVWFTNAGSAEWVQCQCGTLRWRYGKG